ncbi:MAG: hypothetical protein U0800_13520 [Isosphaeraceae bacterium]
MVAATIIEKPQANGHQADRGAPTLQRPRWNEVTPPARMQMIDIEMAKFENPPIRRASSCA